MTEMEIESTADGRNGRYYELADDAPYEGVTVNERIWDYPEAKPR